MLFCCTVLEMHWGKNRCNSVTTTTNNKTIYNRIVHIELADSFDLYVRACVLSRAKSKYGDEPFTFIATLNVSMVLTIDDYEHDWFDRQIKSKSRHHHQHHSKTRSQCYKAWHLFTPQKNSAFKSRTTWQKIRHSQVNFFIYHDNDHLLRFASSLYLLNHLPHSNSKMAEQKNGDVMKRHFIYCLCL